MVEDVNTGGAARPVTGRKWHQHLTSWLFRYHRWFGVVSCVAVMLWGASGVMHPIMSRLNPTPVNPQPPQAAPALHGALTPAEVLKRAGIVEVSGLRVLAWNDASYYQVSLPSQAQRRYFEVDSGNEVQDGDTKYAESLARHFIGDTQGKVTGVSRLDQFDEEYMSINRLLPVYRVNFERDDGLRAYVETSPPRLSALVDNRKGILSWIFRVMHNWEFPVLQSWDTWDTTRMTLITALLSVALLSALSGIWMYGFMWKRGTLQSFHLPLRRWHRGVGIAVSLSALLFVVSAEWHLLGSDKRGLPKNLGARINTAQLELPDSVRHGSWGKIALVQMDGRAYYHLLAVQKEKVDKAPATGDEHDHKLEAKPDEKKKSGGMQAVYMRADTGEVLEGTSSRNHAIWLAGQYSGLPAQQVTDVSIITKFEGEYGFFNKRLPVWRVDYATPEHLSYYVETSSGALATVVRDSARMEGWSFSYLHKFHWLDFAGKDIRDFVMGLFGLGNLVIAVLGLWMFTRRYTKRSKIESEMKRA